MAESSSASSKSLLEAARERARLVRAQNDGQIGRGFNSVASANYEVLRKDDIGLDLGTIVAEDDVEKANNPSEVGQRQGQEDFYEIGNKRHSQRKMRLFYNSCNRDSNGGVPGFGS